METSHNTEVSADAVERLRLVILRLARRVRSQSNEDLTPSQVTVLLTIATFGPLTITEVADREHVKPPAASKIVASLVDCGLVGRTEDPGDRRRSIVSVTDEGRSFVDEFRAAGRTWLLGQMDQLDPADATAIESALPALERLLVAATTAADEDLVAPTE